MQDHPSSLRSTVLTLATAAFLLVAWCAVDCLGVKQPQLSAPIQSWGVAAIPLLFAVTLAVHWRLHRGSGRAGRAGITTILAFLLAVPLILVIGPGFHGRIGGGF